MPSKTAVARTPLGSKFFVKVDNVSCNRHFPSQDRPRRGQGGCHDEARYIRCNDPRGRWRVLRSGGRAADAKTCTGLWDFIETDCQLTWYGITLYGVIDAGFT